MDLGKSTNGMTSNLFWRNTQKNITGARLVTDFDPMFVRKNPVWKRIFDLVGSTAGIILLSPLFLVIAMTIKWVSPGPAIFKQQRVGCGGRLFNCLKFRTMAVNADPDIHRQYLAELIDSSRSDSLPGDPMQKLYADDRIIKFGHFLRASGLDELPQLFNVLLGQMSLIGPRPPIPYEVEQYRLWYKGRFDVVPGLTGLWQISGKNRLGFNEMIRLDIQYAMRRSFWLDCKILLKTPLAIFRQIYEMRNTPKEKSNNSKKTDSKIGGETC